MSSGDKNFIISNSKSVVHMQFSLSLQGSKLAVTNEPYFIEIDFIVIPSYMDFPCFKASISCLRPILLLEEACFNSLYMENNLLFCHVRETRGNCQWKLKGYSLNLKNLKRAKKTIPLGNISLTKQFDEI